MSQPQPDERPSRLALMDGDVVDPRRGAPSTSPARIFWLLMVSLFVAEVAVMTLLEVFEIESLFDAALTDAILLCLIVFPSIYLFVFKPLVGHVEAQNLDGRRLRDSNESLRAMVQNSTDGILLVDGGGTVQFANRAAAKFLGKQSPCEVVGTIFGFSLSVNKVVEIEMGAAPKQPCIVEMRTRETAWYNETWFLITLRDVTDAIEAREELRAQSLSDHLTGLYNRRGFMMLCEQQLRFARRDRRPLKMVFIDVDGLKGINDTLGHEVGDMAIRATAAIIADTFRDADITARLGGDEFVVLCMDAASHNYDFLVKRLQRNTRDWNAARKRPFALSLSYGDSKFDPDNPVSLEELMKRADERMYERKNLKRSEPPE